MAVTGDSMNTQDKTKQELVDELKYVCQRLNEFEPEEVHSPVMKVREEILVVDDELRICELLSRWLTAEGYRCTSAAKGEIALNSLAGKKYDLVVSDIMMPGMSGIDLLKVVKTFSPDTAIIMATAVSDRQTAVMALELGAWSLWLCHETVRA